MAKCDFRDVSLPVDERVRALLEELAPEEKIGLIAARQKAVPRLGIKAVCIGTEAARGLVCRDGAEEYPATVFPEGFGLAASFDSDLMHEIGVIAATEARIYDRDGKCSLFLCAPAVVLAHDPRRGRTVESFGEDPCLAAEMSAAYTKGMFGADEKHARAIPILKRFCADDRGGDGARGASMPLTLKHDYYLKPFELPLKNGGARGVMTSRGSVNGAETMCGSEIGRLKDCGMLFSVTESRALSETATRRKTRLCHAEILAEIYKNRGADIIDDDPEIVEAAAREALERGLIDMTDIDNALFGALKARFLLGEFDGGGAYSDLPRELLCCQEHKRTALRAAEESVILLRNRRGVLPLNPKERYSVIGIHADMNFRDGCVGLSEKNPTVLDGIISLIGRERLCYEAGNDIIALRNAQTGFYFSVEKDGALVCSSPTINEQCLLELFEWGDGAVSFKSRYNGKFLKDDGVMRCVSEAPSGRDMREKFFIERSDSLAVKNWQGRYLTMNEDRGVEVSDRTKPQKNSFFNIEVFSSGIDRVRRAVTETQNAVVFLGDFPGIGAGEGFDRKDLALTEKQRGIAEEVLKLKKDAVIVLISGRPYSIGKEYGTVIHTAHGGPQMGTAIAKTLFGKLSPAGRCPMTWYSSERELGGINDRNIIRTESTYLYYNGEPLFPFGHGLTYTAFKYGGLKLNKTSFESGERVEVSFELENIGNFDSDEVVQLYVKAPRFNSAVPQKELKAFRRIHADRETTAAVILSFGVDDLAFWDVNTNSRKLWRGIYEIQIGASSEDIRLTADITVNGESCGGVDVTRPVSASASWDYVDVEFKTTKGLLEYALLNDRHSSMIFENCRFNGETGVEIVCSNPAAKTELVMTNADNGDEYARIEVPPTGGLERFETFKARVEMPVGSSNIKISAGAALGLALFKFFK